MAAQLLSEVLTVLLCLTVSTNHKSSNVIPKKNPSLLWARQNTVEQCFKANTNIDHIGLHICITCIWQRRKGPSVFWGRSKTPDTSATSHTDPKRTHSRPQPPTHTQTNKHTNKQIQNCIIPNTANNKHKHPSLNHTEGFVWMWE